MCPWEKHKFLDLGMRKPFSARSGAEDQFYGGEERGLNAGTMSGRDTPGSCVTESGLGRGAREDQAAASRSALPALGMSSQESQGRLTEPASSWDRVSNTHLRPDRL